jgi:hypothetical protein
MTNEKKQTITEEKKPTITEEDVKGLSKAIKALTINQRIYTTIMAFNIIFMLLHDMKIVDKSVFFSSDIMFMIIFLGLVVLSSIMCKVISIIAHIFENMKDVV